MAVDKNLFVDVADALGISHPSLIEKDYYVVQLLKLLSTIKISDYSLVFAGGTCLAKVHVNTYRMSEDVDIKLVPETDTPSRKSRKEIHQLILDKINDSEIFKLTDKLTENPKIRNVYKYQLFLLEYPKEHGEIGTLRPEIQLEITESELLQIPITSSISSLYANSLGLDNEVEALYCAALENTAAEKFVALLRRTADYERDNNRKYDPTLIRHIYDLQLILKSGLNIEETKHLVSKVIEIDMDHFGNRHLEFKDAPVNELTYGLNKLKENQKYRDNYENFINPLVYNETAPSWETVISSLEELTTLFLDN